MSSGKYATTSLIALAGMLVFAGVVVASNARSAGDGAVLRMQIIDGDTTTDSTCFLVHKEQRQRDVVYYFLTSGHVLDTEALAEHRTASLRIRVIISEAMAIEASGTDVLFPDGAEQGSDLAIVKAGSADRDVAAVPISMELPDPGQVFVIRRFSGDGLPLLAERVRSRSGRFVVGDRTATDVSGLVGAPAMVEGGVFGLVSTDPRSLRLGDVTVLSLHNQLVKLRFTMMGVQPPPFPAACPQGQALVTVGVNVVVMSRP